jgi:hypothetical protein
LNRLSAPRRKPPNNRDKMFPYIALTQDKIWQPGPYAGVELMVLHRNADTGGVVVLRKFHAGHMIPAHTQ